MNIHSSHLVAFALLATAFGLAPAAAQTTTRVSVSSTGVEGNFTSHAPAVSADGRYVAFDSDTTNLVAGDTNNRSDVFVRDRQTNLTTRVSVDSAGVQGDDTSWFPSLSADGRYVAFWSSATNLVAGDTNGAYDVFVHDRQTGQTSRVSLSSASAQGSSGSYSPSLSADGRYVAFWSYANDLVLGDTNGWADVFVRDRQTGQTTRVSVDSSGAEGNAYSSSPSISGDGRYVSFESFSSNLVAGDNNFAFDVFVHDRQTALTTRVSVSSAGAEGVSNSTQPSISADGRYVAFESYSAGFAPPPYNGWPDIFVHDRQTGTTTLVSQSSAGVAGDYNSQDPAISADGRFVVFTSLATNLVAGDSNGFVDVFRRDLQTGQTTRVSIGSGGAQGNQGSGSAALSGDGRYVAFESSAANLVPLDFNGAPDVFVRDNGVIAVWTNLGFALAGTNGLPQLGASGAFAAGVGTTLSVSNGAGSAIGALVLGTTNLALPIYGGVLVPDPFLVLPLATSPAGTAAKLITWPATLPTGIPVYTQAWLLDAAGVQGFAATNALTSTSS